MAEEAEVVVEPNAAILAVQHLTEQGRGQGKSARSIASKVQGLVQSRWGTAQVPRFEDGEGGGWLIDVSPAFDDEAMYAVVRTKEGQRTVTHIVEEDDAFKMARPSQPPPDEPEVEVDLDEEVDVAAGTPLADMGIPPDFGEAESQREHIAMLERELSERDGEVAALRGKVDKLTPGHGDPVLIRWTTKSEGDEPVWQEDRKTYGDVDDRVQTLMAKGVAPENIEVWTSLKKPQVKVELV